MTRLDRDPLLRAIYDATQAVEACGASEALTAAVMAVTAIYQHADRVLDERDEAIRRAETEARCAARYRWLKINARRIDFAGLCVSDGAQLDARIDAARKD